MPDYALTYYFYTYFTLMGRVVIGSTIDIYINILYGSFIYRKNDYTELTCCKYSTKVFTRY